MSLDSKRHDELVNARVRIQELTNSLTAARTSLEKSRTENARLHALTLGHLGEIDRMRLTIAELSQRPRKEAYDALVAKRYELEAECNRLEMMAVQNLGSSLQVPVHVACTTNTHDYPADMSGPFALAATLRNKELDELLARYGLGPRSPGETDEAFRLRMVAMASFKSRNAVEPDPVDSTYSITVVASLADLDPNRVRRAIVPAFAKYEKMLRVFLGSHLRIIATKPGLDDNVDYLIEGDILPLVPPNSIPMTQGVSAYNVSTLEGKYRLGAMLFSTQGSVIASWDVGTWASPEAFTQETGLPATSVVSDD